jgi:hypothetical protein
MSEPDSVPVQLALGEWGVSPTFEWRGKSYALGHPTQVKKAVYENALADAEKAHLDSQLARGWVTPAKYDEKLDALTAAIDGPRFEHMAGGAIWMDYAFGAKAQTGTVLFLWSLFAPNHPDLTPADARAMLEDAPALVRFHLRKVVPSFFEWAAAQLQAPPEAMARVREAIAGALAGLEPPTPGTPTDTPPSPSTPS